MTGQNTASAARAGLGWLLDLQNHDGGWPTFCRGWGHLPFDRSGTDLTAHALRALENATNRVGRALTVHATAAPPSAGLALALAAAETEHPELLAQIGARSPEEPYRTYLLFLAERVQATRLRQAHLKQPASMEDINYRHARQLDRALLRSLASCDWVRQHHNLTLTGPAGVGKTYLCCALLEKACREGFTAYYAAAGKFFRQLTLAYADGSFDRLLGKLARLDVLAIDDWGLTPLSDTERRYLLEVLEDRCSTRSTVLTSQFPVETWHDLIGNPTLADAILERILSNHHEIALKGRNRPFFVEKLADNLRRSLSDVPGVSAPNPVGVDGAQPLACARLAGLSPHVSSLDLVEINPRFDRDGQTRVWH